MIDILLFLFTGTLIGLWLIKIYYKHLNKDLYFICSLKEDSTYKDIYDWYIKEIIEIYCIPEEYFK